MKTFFTSLNLVETHHLRNLLSSAGIRCRILNEDLARLAGEVPFPECAMRIVVERETDFAAAEAIVGDYLRPPRRSGPPWRCGTCAETIEAQFTSCWKCGAESSGADRP